MIGVRPDGIHLMTDMLKTAFLGWTIAATVMHGGITLSQTDWISASDEALVAREGGWSETSHRYAEHGHLTTVKDGAALTLNFEASGITLRLGRHAVPAYAPPDRGELVVRVDDGPGHTIQPLAEAREIVLARDLPPGEHTIRVEHRVCERGAGIRIEGFGISRAPTGEIAFSLTGDRNAYLVDARAILTCGGELIAARLVRNPLTGQCRLTGLPPHEGYRLELRAIGWESAVIENISVRAGGETCLSPIHLSADASTITDGWLFPHIGRQAVRRPGESFRARLQVRDAEIIGARLERVAGPATISRALSIEEDEAAAFYYDREIVLTLPEDAPPGLYDLSVRTRLPGQRVERELRSPRAVMVVREYPADPIFISWGHLDTQAQYQAEYLRDLVGIANLAGADMALIANACNPAYVAGALADLRVPYVVNFGNHQFPGFEQWFGPQEGIVDLGPGLCVLNRSRPWHEGVARADALLTARAGVRTKVINAFEPNAPIELLDRHRVALLHDGHGPGARVMDVGATPTLRVGKSNSESFRMIRFRAGRVESCTYMDETTAPIPFARGATPPLRVSVDPPANGTHGEATATIVNDLQEPFPNCRVTLVMAAGAYACRNGRIECVTTSDCGKYCVLTVRADVAAQSEAAIRIYPAGN